MIQRILPARGSFGPTLAYALNPGKGRLLDTHLLGADGSDPRAVAEELAAYRDLFRPGVEKPVFHAALRLPAGEQLSDEEWRDAVTPAAAPLGLGPVHHIDTSVPVTDAQVCRLALTIRAGLPATSTPLPAFRSLPALRRD